ncbi:hypothetical protein ACVXG7_09400 [Enterobacter hormaechei]
MNVALARELTRYVEYEVGYQFYLSTASFRAYPQACTAPEHRA